MNKDLFNNLSEIVEKAVKNAFASFQNGTIEHHGDWEYLPNIPALANFLGCSYTTAKRLKHLHRIKFFQNGTNVKFFIPDVIYAIDHDPVVSKHFHKHWDLISGKPAVPSQPPKIYVETELYPDRFIFATIRYQGWRCCICIPEHLWNDANRVADFINQVILHRHAKYPFRIPPVINNQ